MIVFSAKQAFKAAIQEAAFNTYWPF